MWRFSKDKLLLNLSYLQFTASEIQFTIKICNSYISKHTLSFLKHKWKNAKMQLGQNFSISQEKLPAIIEKSSDESNQQEPTEDNQPGTATENKNQKWQSLAMQKPDNKKATQSKMAEQKESEIKCEPQQILNDQISDTSVKESESDCTTYDRMRRKKKTKKKPIVPAHLLETDSSIIMPKPPAAKKQPTQCRSSHGSFGDDEMSY